MSQTRLKICGLYRTDDVLYINETKPDYAGFIIGFPRSHRNVTPAELIQLTRTLDPSIPAVGVFVNAPVNAIRRLLDEDRIQIAQLHGEEDEATIRELKKSGKEIWKAYRIQTLEDVKRAIDSPADRILLDAGKGEGKPFDWELLRGIEREYILAGGLNASNLADAIRNLAPYGVDLSSGVETEKRKDFQKIQKVVQIVRKA